MMNITLKATGIDMTPAISEYAEKKIASLEKFLPGPADTYLVRVEIGKTTHHHREGLVYRAEVHITGNGLDQYTAEEAEDLYAAIDKVEAEAARELQSTRGRKEKLLRRGQRRFKDIIRGFSSGFKRFRK